MKDGSCSSNNWAFLKFQQATEYAFKGFLKRVKKDSFCNSVSMLITKAEFEDGLFNDLK